MSRRFAGSGFALVLLAMVALKHVALGFCLCQAQVVTNPATCCTAAAPVADCCCEENDKTPTETPCRDCLVEIDLGVGAFLWSAEEFAPESDIGTPIAVPSGDLATIPARTSAGTVRLPARGSPPGQPPLFLRHSVLRL